MASLEHKNFVSADESLRFQKGQLDFVTVGGVHLARGIFQPGWTWFSCVKPLVKTNWCDVPQLQFHVAGRMHVVMEDGQEAEFWPGDVSFLPPRHDAWVVGDERVVVIDIGGCMTDFAKPK